MENKIELYIKQGYISDKSKIEILQLAVHLHDLFYSSSKEKALKFAHFTEIIDSGVKEVDFSKNSYLKCRALTAKTLDNRIIKFGLHFYARHNGNCLAVAISNKNNVYTNMIQLVLDKYVSIENDSYWIFHDGTVGGHSIPRLETLTYVENNGMIIHRTQKHSLISLGNLPLGVELKWTDKNVLSFFDSLLFYCVLRYELKEGKVSNSEN